MAKVDDPEQQALEDAGLSFPLHFTPMQRAFCIEYLSNGENALAAARAAGYKKPGPSSHDLIKTPAIRKFLLAHRQGLLDAAMVTEKRIVEQLANIAFFDPADIMTSQGEYLPFEEWPVHARAAVTDVRIEHVAVGEAKRNQPAKRVPRVVRIKRADPLRALETLAKWRGMLAGDSHQHVHLHGEELVERLNRGREMARQMHIEMEAKENGD